MAEGYLKSLNIDNLSVKSRGLSADGSKVSKNSEKAMAEIGIDIKEHISKQLGICDIAWADKIICMSPSHKTVLDFYAKGEKVFVLGDGIPDPFGADILAYRNCREAIINQIDILNKDGFFSEITIVSLQREHIKHIAELEKSCFSSPWSEEMILESFVNGTKFFVATQNGEVLGYVGISCILDEGYITNIAVFEEHRKKGVGTALINRLFSLASDIKLDFISLEVRASNETAISLYTKLGFKQEGRRKNFYTAPTEDALIMTKRFEI